MNKKCVQPDKMVNSPAFSQAIEIRDLSSILVVGGQNAVDSNGKIVGRGDFSGQCKQALSNLKIVLEDAGYSIEDVVKWTIYMVLGNDPRQGYLAFQEVFGTVAIPPTITVVQVAGFASPDYLVEIEAMAVK